MEKQTKPEPLGAPMAKKLILAVIVILCLGAALGVAGYLIMNKPTKIQQLQISPTMEPTITVEDETADWKIYRNEEYGFELKYLNDWLVKEEKDNVYFKRNISQEEIERQEIGYPLIILVENTSIKSVSDWFENEFSDRTEDSKPEKYSVKIGGLDGIKFSDSISIGGCNEDFVVIKNEKLFRILRHSSTCDYSDVVFTQILSTFKFTK